MWDFASMADYEHFWELIQRVNLIYFFFFKKYIIFSLYNMTLNVGEEKGRKWKEGPHEDWRNQFWSEVCCKFVVECGVWSEESDPSLNIRVPNYQTCHNRINPKFSWENKNFFWPKRLGSVLLRLQALKKRSWD